MIKIKPFRGYFSKEVQCGGKKGDSVRLQQTSCVSPLMIYEIKAYSTAFKPGTSSTVKSRAQKYGQALSNYNAAVFNCFKFPIQTH